MAVIASIIMGIVLGITEFLPVSSVGHSLVLSALLSFPPTQAARDTFAVFIEAGALLAVVFFYRRDLLKQARQFPKERDVRRFWLNILIAFLPIGIIGFIFHDWIERTFFSPLIVGISLIVGGVVFLAVERRKKVPPQTVEFADMTPRQALWVGLAQILALIPGVSRSGATIVGGLLAGLDRKIATVFTFYLLMPTLAAASGYEIFSALRKGTLAHDLIPYFLLAAFVAFLVSLLAMRWLLGFIRKHDFQVFGVYRIILGVIVIALILIGFIH
ncbi:MAG: undecaprenyl-diphosphate phosphatase [Anaerolineales bacterium]